MKNNRRIGSSLPAKLVGLTAITIMGLCGSLQAQLFLHVDTGTEQVWFTGTDSGTPYTSGSHWLDWLDGVPGGADSLTEITAAALIPTGNSYAPLSYLRSYDSGLATQVTPYFTSANPVTLTGGGPSNPLSYAAWTAAAKAHLEGLVGGSLALSRGTGFQDISVVAVPEPHEYALMAGLGLLSFAGWRRRQNRA